MLRLTVKPCSREEEEARRRVCLRKKMDVIIIDKLRLEKRTIEALPTWYHKSKQYREINAQQRKDETVCVCVCLCVMERRKRERERVTKAKVLPFQKNNAGAKSVSGCKMKRRFLDIYTQFEKRNEDMSIKSKDQKGKDFPPPLFFSLCLLYFLGVE